MADATETGGSFGPAAAPPRRGFRLVQYNVRGLTSAEGAPMVEAVGSTLRALQPAVVCLNEVDLRQQPDGVRRLAEEVGASHWHFFGHAGGGTYGNALLARFPIVEARDVHLEGGTIVEWPPGSGNRRRIARGMTAVTLALPADCHQENSFAGAPSRAGGESCSGQPKEITVFCTHLDHINPEQRLVQMRHILREMEGAQAQPHLLVGDLNALHSPDYSEPEWAALQARAAEQGWTPPMDDDCLRLLLNRGYIDAFRQGCGAGAHGPLPTDIPKFTAHHGRPMYRIDYVLLSAQDDAGSVGLSVAAAHIDVTAATSDHFPLVVDLVWEEAACGAPPPNTQSRL